MNNWKKHFKSKSLKLWTLSIASMGAIFVFFAFINSSYSSKMTASPAFDLAYNVEQVTTTTYNNAEGTCYEGISQLSDADNYTVKCVMSEEGEFEMTINLGQSSQDISQQGYEEPNLRRVGMVKVNNNTMTTYDSNGNIIESGANQGSELSLASLKSIVQMSSQNTYDAIIAAAQSGSNFQSPTGENFKIESSKNGLIRMSSGEAEYLINTQKRVLQAVTSMDASGKITNERVMDAERKSDGSYVLYAIHEMSYEPIPNSNAVAVKKVTQEFKNFRLIDYNGKSTFSK